MCRNLSTAEEVNVYSIQYTRGKKDLKSIFPRKYPLRRVKLHFSCFYYTLSKYNMEEGREADWREGEGKNRDMDAGMDGWMDGWMRERPGKLSQVLHRDEQRLCTDALTSLTNVFLTECWLPASNK